MSQFVSEQFAQNLQSWKVWPVNTFTLEALPRTFEPVLPVAVANALFAKESLEKKRR